MPTWPQHIPLLPWHYWPFRQFLVLASPPSIPLSAYVYAVLGVPPTQTGTVVPDLLNSYRRAFSSDCDYGSTVVTVNATVHRLFVPMKGRRSDRNAHGNCTKPIDMGEWCLKPHYSHQCLAVAELRDVP